MFALLDIVLSIVPLMRSANYPTDNRITPPPGFAITPHWNGFLTPVSAKSPDVQKYVFG
jgi:hypothetical protein